MPISDDQEAKLFILREAAKEYAHLLEVHLPEGPDKTYIMRKLRDISMWANTCVLRHSDGRPRE